MDTENRSQEVSTEDASKGVQIHFVNKWIVERRQGDELPVQIDGQPHRLGLS